MVMYAGRAMETGDRRTLYLPAASPVHSGLAQRRCRAGPGRERLTPIAGSRRA